MHLARYDTNQARRDQLAMVEGLWERGIRDRDVLEAFLEVPRQHFLPDALGNGVHEDLPLPIGHQQTSSPPYLVGRLLETLELRPGDRVLEVGTGSGYPAALLSLLCNEVITVEIVPELAEAAHERLRRLGRSNVRVVTADGSCGLEEYGPYDVIVVASGAACVPSALLDQLLPGGYLVIPEGEGDAQLLRRYRKEQTPYNAYAAFAECDGPAPLWHTFVPVVRRQRAVAERALKQSSDWREDSPRTRTHAFSFQLEGNAQPGAA